MAKKKTQRIVTISQPPQSDRFWYEAAIAPAGEMTGHEWEVTIIGPKDAGDLLTVEGKQFLRSKNGRLYDLAALEASTPQWEGVKVYDNHLTDEEFERKQGMRSVSGEWLGTIVKPFWESATNSIRGFFKVAEDSLAAKLKNAHKQGILSAIGLSIDTFPIVNRQAMIEGQRMPIIEGFKKIMSVDLVAEPAAGGSFDRITAAQTTYEEQEMNTDEIKQLVSDTIAQTIPDVVRDAVAAALPAQQDEPVPEVAEVETAAAEEEAQPKDGPTEAPETSEAIRRLECRMELSDALQAAKLTPAGQQIVTEAFAARTFERAELDKFIKTVKASEAAQDPSGQVDQPASGRIVAGMNEDDKLQNAFLQLVMLPSEFKALEHSESDIVTDRIPESYRAWVKTGRQRNNYRRMSELFYDLLGGDYFADDRAAEAATTSSMSSIVKNALNVMVAADYAKRHQWWDGIVRTEEVDTIDQATLVRVYGMNTLDVVTEGAAYTELPWTDEEETASFIKKGNYAGITMETLLKDKTGAVRTIPTRLASSWFNTISKLVANVFTVNSDAGPVLADTGALFNATAIGTAGGHVNLLTTAFGTTTAAYDAARLAMRIQTDQTLGAGERLGIIPKTILTPYDLETAASVVINSEVVPGSANNDINPFFRESNVVGVPHWTDTNNWALAADPMEWPAIWLIFLRGQTAPSLFTADNETAGAMFTNDTLRYKVRMLTWRFSDTYDCAPVSDFRPLHKSNVA